ncbi:conserved membrane hypothetical protein [Hyella patelloides LEGE 07179]|uniref:Glycosyltransferase RgtA/B/C/D-like domain-containing protein n=1 Tax=Hyella patelloides LEGE 07179 TaxID=945734 RepID=A0A563VN14_9CYAN|nr:hypothetical protein [Hyella patelloides]VEP12757.1 conserved membrane hypothetical protein [Hyella patelloides LEGE 07179]
MKKLLKRQHYIHLALLCIWLIIGAVLRFTNLGLKPPWSDEWATLVFSLGNSFRTIPLNEIISLDMLLSPLQVDVTQTARDTINNLLTESTHPPLYFVLNHWWLQLTGQNNSLVSIWWGRCFSALWGIAAIPGMFALGYLWFRSLMAAHIASVLMAVSPFGVYLAQEARHYTLAILWVMASLACLVIACRVGIAHLTPKIILILSWIVINVLGVTTHYFFTLALVAETLVLVAFWWKDIVRDKNNLLNRYWQRIYLAIIGTVIGCLPWLYIWRSIPDNQLTSWVYQENSWLKFYEPIGRIFLWLITKIGLLPVEGVSETVTIASGIIILSTLGWLFSFFLRGYQQLKKNQDTQLAIIIIEQFVLSAIACILIITYTVGADLTLSSRFQFFYFPGFLLFLAGISHYLWQKKQQVVVVLIALGICGSLTINHNLAFQKVERPDVVVPVMVEAYDKIPVIIAIQHYTHGQTGEMMSLGWQFQELINQQQIAWQPQFFLAHQEIATTDYPFLSEHLNSITHPFQLWLVNFSPTPELANSRCIPDQNYQRRATGYKYRLYSCNL